MIRRVYSIGSAGARCLCAFAVAVLCLWPTGPVEAGACRELKILAGQLVEGGPPSLDREGKGRVEVRSLQARAIQQVAVEMHVAVPNSFDLEGGVPLTFHLKIHVGDVGTHGVVYIWRRASKRWLRGYSGALGNYSQTPTVPLYDPAAYVNADDRLVKVRLIVDKATEHPFSVWLDYAGLTWEATQEQPGPHELALREAAKEPSILLPSGIDFDEATVRRSPKIDIIRKEWEEMQRRNRQSAARDAREGANTVKNRLNRALGLGKHSKKSKKRSAKKRH